MGSVKQGTVISSGCRIQEGGFQKLSEKASARRGYLSRELSVSQPHEDLGRECLFYKCK